MKPTLAERSAATRRSIDAAFARQSPATQRAQLLSAAAALLQAFVDGTITDGERRDADETIAQLRDEATKA